MQDENNKDDKQAEMVSDKAYDGCKSCYKVSSKKVSAAARIFGHLVAILFLIFFAYLINNYYQRLNFLSESFTAVLWLLNISIGVGVFSNLIQIITQSNLIKHLLKIVENIVSFAVFFTAYKIFPFNISGRDATIIRIFLIFVIIGVSIAIIVELVQLISGKDRD